MSELKTSYYLLFVVLLLSFVQPYISIGIPDHIFNIGVFIVACIVYVLS
nr:MAG TPA: hypothetical protein [Bacteriophage sp.]